MIRFMSCLLVFVATALVTVDHVSHVKQWTLTATGTNDGDDKIGSLNLDLTGRVFVSYVSDVPSGVLGYVNVSGDSHKIVNFVTVLTNDVNDEQLHVRINDNNDSPTVEGYLLTEIILVTSGVVSNVQSQLTSEVVIENGVLVTSDVDEELQLKLEVMDAASLPFSAESVSVTVRGKLTAHDASNITVLPSSFDSAKLKRRATKGAFSLVSQYARQAPTAPLRILVSMTLPRPQLLLRTERCWSLSARRPVEQSRITQVQ
ncbi:hypothetical protein PHYPSEUDO_013856 [Phytophthora pseudosyringae]|uniref:Uncharacterized protein n=1 Tax=Phytophthora pseudosyringae TaxID=221518 RepID=A0A8T1V849_9STRA|nr:hypothetical protein PHYPSEUDO_013856 [Phytophthora pseudosyringae]